MRRFRKNKNIRNPYDSSSLSKLFSLLLTYSTFIIVISSFFYNYLYFSILGIENEHIYLDFSDYTVSLACFLPALFPLFLALLIINYRKINLFFSFSFQTKKVKRISRNKSAHASKIRLKTLSAIGLKIFLGATFTLVALYAYLIYLNFDIFLVVIKNFYVYSPLLLLLALFVPLLLSREYLGINLLMYTLILVSFILYSEVLDDIKKSFISPTEIIINNENYILLRALGAGFIVAKDNKVMFINDKSIVNFRPNQNFVEYLEIITPNIK